VTDRADVFLALASVVAGEMYEKSFPMVAVSRDEFELIQTGDEVEILDDGSVRVSKK